MQPDQLTLAYLAGMIDGDGYISITRSRHKGRIYFGPQIGIAGTRREPHDLAASIWGGKIYEYRNGIHRPQFQWSRVGATAATAIAQIHPYLRIKADHADLALELWQHLEDGRCEDPFPWFSATYDPIAVRHDMREQMIALNQSRKKVKAGALLDGREWRELPE